MRSLLTLFSDEKSILNGSENHDILSEKLARFHICLCYVIWWNRLYATDGEIDIIQAFDDKLLAAAATRQPTTTTFDEQKFIDQLFS